MSTPPRTRADQRGADLWFRLMGLPTFVPLRRWFTDLPRRVAPLIASVTIARFLLQDLVDDAIEVAVEFFGTDEWAIFASVLVLIGIALAIAWIAYALLRGLLRRLRPPVGAIVATAAVVLCLAGLIVGGYLVTPDATVGPVLSALALVLGCVLFTGMGGGALLTWASRLASMPLEVVRIEVASATLPLTVNLLKAAALLSVIATLPFVFSAVSEARYRERFFDPIMADMRRAIAVRDALRV